MIHKPKPINGLKDKVLEDSSSLFMPGRDEDNARTVPNGISCLKLLPENSDKSEVHHPYQKMPNAGVGRYQFNHTEGVLVRPQAMLCAGDLLEMSECTRYRVASEPGLSVH